MPLGIAWAEVAVVAPVAFLIGLACGLAERRRYRLVRKGGER